MREIERMQGVERTSREMGRKEGETTKRGKDKKKLTIILYFDISECTRACYRRREEGFKESSLIKEGKLKKEWHRWWWWWVVWG